MHHPSGMKHRYRRILAQFQAQEKPESILLLAGDADLVRIAVAWYNVTFKVRRSLTPLPERASESQRWDWLWQNVRFSRQELMEKAGLSPQHLDLKLKTLTGNRILYPDGSLNAFAQRYLRERVIKIFQSTAHRLARRNPRVSQTAPSCNHAAAG